MKNLLRATMAEMFSDIDDGKRWWTYWLQAIGPGAVASVPGGRECVPKFLMMCEAIRSDIQNPKGSGAATLQALERVEQGHSASEELGGNAWYTYITRDKVWFEGLFDQGAGGEVSFEQYKLAVQVYLRFLSDPEHKPIAVDFPEDRPADLASETIPCRPSATTFNLSPLKPRMRGPRSRCGTTDSRERLAQRWLAASPGAPGRQCCAGRPLGRAGCRAATHAR